MAWHRGVPACLPVCDLVCGTELIPRFVLLVRPPDETSRRQPRLEELNLRDCSLEDDGAAAIVE